MIGSLFADIIKYKDYSGTIYNIENVTYLGVNGDKIYYTESSAKQNWMFCSAILEIIDSNGDNIPFDCDDNSYTSQITTATPQITTSSSELAKAGKHLIKFKEDYFTGIYTSLAGVAGVIFGVLNSDSNVLIVGQIFTLVGGVISIISHNEVSKVGENLINASELLEAEQEEKEAKKETKEDE